MKNQGENKSRSNAFHQFILNIANLIGPLYIFHFLLNNIYILIQKESANNSYFTIWSMQLHARTCSYA